MKSFFRKFRYGEKGFTLIELLVVIAILGVLAAVAVPNVGKFMNRGKAEAQATELSNIQLGVVAMLADSTTGVLNTSGTPDVTATTLVGLWCTTDSPPKVLSSYMTGLNTDGSVKTAKVTYDLASDSTVTQHIVP